jgi:L-threonylcarbamoyladenylate synthase
VFAVKGRPANHPLIVHIASQNELTAWAANVPPVAFTLADALWPGPLTMVLHRSARASDAVTGGADTVALRVPAHPVALQLLKEFGGALAAPSANRFGSVSPTSADHVRADLGSDVDLIIDGGECAIGVESTIVDLTGASPSILRPGGVTAERLAEVLGQPLAAPQHRFVATPGQLPSHYAPHARVVVVTRDELEGRLLQARTSGVHSGVIDPDAGSIEDAARQLYAELRRLDDQGCDEIFVILPSEVGLGLAIADRLRKAAGPRDTPSHLPRVITGRGAR